MKKLHLSKRLIAIALSAAVCSSAPLSVPLSFTSYAVSDAESPVSAEPVDVIIKLAGDCILGSPEAKDKGTSFIGTAEANAAEARILETQKSAEKQLRELYPELEITRSFSIVSNSFACFLPENLLAQAEQLPLVESVMRVNTYTEPVPEMNNASKLCGISDFAAEHGSLGEGEVIAVLDTEFTTSHPMFAPIDDKNIAVTKDSIGTLASSGKLAAGKIDPDKAYISSKIPFAYDYSDDTPYDVSAPENYHGTHVCGIAAGEPFKNSEGVTVSGVAPDAQLLMMKVFGTYTDPTTGRSSTTYNDYSVQCALEDAALLGADIINMSFGRNVDNIGKIPYVEALANLYSCGVTICVSAGNGADNLIGRFGKANVENVDTGTVTEPSIFPFVLSVASADNSVAAMHTFTAGEKSYRFCECGTALLSSSLAGQSPDTVFFGSGDIKKITSENAKDKLIIYSGPEESFKNVTSLSEKAGAAGIILNCEWCANQIEYPLYSLSIPVASVSSKDMQELLMFSPKKISLPKDSSVTYELPETVSYFSSCGTDNDLDIKPEIMGIGGNVLSAACDGDTSIMSGTSMSSPYVAGCTALIVPQLKERGVLPENGFEKNEMIKNIIMNTADIYEKDGVPISPRRQGAGLINVYKAANANAFITRYVDDFDTGLAKIQLLGNVTSEISFSIQIKNISDKDITFTANDVVLTTDGWEKDPLTGRNVISGQTLLKTTCDIPDTITVYAGKATTVPVTVTIDEKQFKEIGDIFTSGFFAEGFLKLSGAENCCDLSVPILGFCGSWTGVPNIDTISEPPVPVVNSGYNEMRTDYSTAKLVKLFQQFLELTDGYESPEYFAYSGNIKNEAVNFAGQEFADKAEACSDGTVYVSPDKNGIADWFGIYYLPIREGAFSGINITGTNDGTAYPAEFVSKNVGQLELAMSTGSATAIKDGYYMADISSYIESPYAERDIQKLEYPLVVDTEPPTAEFNVTEKDGRKILEVKASDPNLDGIYIIGEKTNGNDDAGTNSEAAIRCAMNYITHNTLYNTAEKFIDALGNASINDSLQQYTSPVCEIIKYTGGADYYYNYFDVIPAEPDKNGNFTASVDITDLNEYSVSVLDRAFNSTYTETGSLPAVSFLTGSWMTYDTEGSGFILKFSADNKCTAVSIADKSETDLTYTLSDGDLTCFTKDGKELLKANITFKSKDMAEAAVSSGTFKGCTFIMEYIFTESTKDVVSFYSTNELEKLALDYYERVNGYRPQHADSKIVAENSAYISVYDSLEDYDSTAVHYTVSLFSGSGTDSSGNMFDLTEFAPISEGTWKGRTTTNDLNDPRFFRFNADGTGKFAWQKDGKEIPFTYTSDKNETVFTFEDGSSEKASVFHYDSDSFMLTWSDGKKEYFTRQRKAADISDIGFYSNVQLKEMAADYLFDTTGVKADEIYANYGMEENKVSIALLSGGDFIDNYTVNFYTGKGVNIIGRPVDIAAKKAAPPAGVPSLGDIDGDSEVNSVDASFILAEYAALSTGKKTTFTAEQTAAADLNYDKEVNSSDASLVLAYYSFVSTGGKGTVENFLKTL